jgi:hypothetical protein
MIVTRLGANMVTADLSVHLSARPPYANFGGSLQFTRTATVFLQFPFSATSSRFVHPFVLLPCSLPPRSPQLLSLISNVPRLVSELDAHLFCSTSHSSRMLTRLTRASEGLVLRRSNIQIHGATSSFLSRTSPSPLYPPPASFYPARLSQGALNTTKKC